jgi:hypothetical protein
MAFEFAWADEMSKAIGPNAKIAGDPYSSKTPESERKYTRIVKRC